MIVRLLSILLLVALSATLINSNIYGDSSLTALFTFWLISSFATICIVFFVFQKRFSNFLKLPKYFIAIFGFALYVCLHGLIFPASELSRIYWISCTLYLLSVYLITASQSKSIQGINSLKLFIHSGISVLAGIEGVIVLLQYLHVIPVPSPLFRCTGTWANPNISAIFLSLSLFSIFYANKSITLSIQKIVLKIWLIVAIIAVLLLGSRTAFVVATVIILFEVSHQVLAVINKFIDFNKRKFNYTLIAVIASMLLALTIFTKGDSSVSRIKVLSNSIGLIAQQPILGYGFGQFEREYNLYAANKKESFNEHVNMAYNDFVELTIEGGVIGLLIWILFLSLLFHHSIKNKQNQLLPILISFLIIQCTNFGFQAIPVVILFLTIIGVETVGETWYSEDTDKFLTRPTLFWRFPSLMLIIGGVSLFIFIKVSVLSNAFYQKNTLAKESFGAERVNKLLSLSETLGTYASYQESLGDGFLQASNYQKALPRYLLAAEKTSMPAVYSKIGFCYQKLNQFDSSQKHYFIVQNMEPQKLSPHLALLNLYHQKRDTGNLITEAKIIANMRIKIKNKRSVEIKNYADSILKSVLTTN